MKLPDAELVRLTAVAQWLGIDRRTVLRWCDAEGIPAARRGRCIYLRRDDALRLAELHVSPVTRSV